MTPAARGAVAALALGAIATAVILTGSGVSRETVLVPAGAGFGLTLVWLRLTLRAAEPDRRGLWLFLVGAVILRALTFVAGDPVFLSDDVYRYAFEGHVILDGGSPWHFAPASPRWDELTARADLDDVRRRINHAEIATIYPPVAQLLFAVGALLPDAIVGWRLVTAAFDLALLVMLAALLHRLGRRPEWLVLYAASPLVLLEGALTAHVDLAAAACLVAALLATRGGRRHLAWWMLFASVMTKVAALVLLPWFLARAGWRGAIGPTVLGVAMILAALLVEPEPVPVDMESPAAVTRDFRVLVGRYELERDGASLGVFDFDGRGKMRPMGFYALDADGAFSLYSMEHGPQRVSRVWLTEDRLRLVPVAGTPNPVYGTKRVDSPFMGLRQYGDRWTANAPVFRMLKTILGTGDDRDTHDRARRYAMIAFGVLVAGLFLAHRRQSLETAAVAVLAALWLLSPTVHPWYLLWLVPLVVLRPWPPLILWTGTVLLAYPLADDGPRWLEAVEYGLPAAVASWLIARGLHGRSR